MAVFCVRSKVVSYVDKGTSQQGALRVSGRYFGPGGCPKNPLQDAERRALESPWQRSALGMGQSTPKGSERLRKIVSPTSLKLHNLELCR